MDRGEVPRTRPICPSLCLVLILFLISTAMPAAASAAPAADEVRLDAALLRYPDVGQDKIVFVYANDLWLVDKSGGQAVPLASPPGVESFPRFSVDDQTIAFMGNYDGNSDLYTIEAMRNRSASWC